MCRKCIEEMDIPAEEKEKLIAEFEEASKRLDVLIPEALKVLAPVVNKFSDQDYGAQAMVTALALTCGRLISYAPTDIQPKILISMVEQMCRAIAIDGVKITPHMIAVDASKPSGAKIKAPVLH